jgi:8-oxo-dGTP pyrophosphatase MutT (NUDIX family)
MQFHKFVEERARGRVEGKEGSSVTTESMRDLEVQLRARLQLPLPGVDAQRRFAPRPLHAAWTAPPPATARQAAVLLLIYPGADGPTVPLTIRHAQLPQHAGQISLPGGSIDPGESAEAAALRETDEELGISPASVRVIGALSTLWVPVSNFVVAPIVAVADTAPTFRADPKEVDGVVQAPIVQLRDITRLKWTTRKEAERRYYPYFSLDEHRVWGATAAILGEFLCLLDPDYAPPAHPVPS